MSPVKTASFPSGRGDRADIRTPHFDDVDVDRDALEIVELRDHKSAKTMQFERRLEGRVNIRQKCVPRRAKDDVRHWSTCAS